MDGTVNKAVTAVLMTVLGLYATGCQSGVGVGTFKGTFDVYFTGQAIDANSGNGLKEFTVDITLGTKPCATKVVAVNGSEYCFAFKATTINGTTYFRDVGLFDYRSISVLGPSDEYLVFEITSPGYLSRKVRIPKDKIAIDQVNVTDIVLTPKGFDVEAH